MIYDDEQIDPNDARKNGRVKYLQKKNEMANKNFYRIKLNWSQYIIEKIIGILRKKILFFKMNKQNYRFLFTIAILNDGHHFFYPSCNDDDNNSSYQHTHTLLRWIILIFFLYFISVHLVRNWFASKKLICYFINFVVVVVDVFIRIEFRIQNLSSKNNKK